MYSIFKQVCVQNPRNASRTARGVKIFEVHSIKLNVECQSSSFNFDTSQPEILGGPESKFSNTDVLVKTTVVQGTRQT